MTATEWMVEAGARSAGWLERRDAAERAEIKAVDEECKRSAFISQPVARPLTPSHALLETLCVLETWDELDDPLVRRVETAATLARLREATEHIDEVMLATSSMLRPVTPGAVAASVARSRARRKARRRTA